MEWVSETGLLVSTIFWKAGEPIHYNGDCVYLEINEGLLAMADCEEEMPSLCMPKEQ